MSEPELGIVADLPVLPKIAAATDAEKERIASNRHRGGGKTVPFESIIVGDDNTRDAAATDIAGLAQSIRLVGLVQPLAVEPAAGGKWLVAAGHRRYLALAALGYGPGDRVPVHPLAKSEGHERSTRMLAENRHRVDLSPVEEAHLIARLKKWYGMKHSAIAEHMGIGANTVGERLLLLQLPPDQQDRVSAGDLPIELAVRVGRMIRDGATADDLARVMGDGVTAADVAAVEHRRKVRVACERLTRRLEARRVTVLAALPGTMVRGPWMGRDEDEVMTVIDVTITGADGRRVVLVEPGSYGDAAAYAVAPKPKHPTEVPEGAESGAGDVWDAGAEERHRARMAWLAAWAVAPSGVIAWTILAGMIEDDLAGMMEALGEKPVRDGDGTVLVGATIEAWLVGKSLADLERMLFAALVFTAQDDDHPDSGTVRWASLRSVGMPGFGPRGG